MGFPVVYNVQTKYRMFYERFYTNQILNTYYVLVCLQFVLILFFFRFLLSSILADSQLMFCTLALDCVQNQVEILNLKSQTRK